MTTKYDREVEVDEYYGPVSPTFIAPTKGRDVRVFESGATRDRDDDKLDFEGFLSPLVIERYAQYLHKHRTLADGSVRASDNWQKGLPLEVYMKSMWRHFFAVWKSYRKGAIGEDDLCGLLFNAMGMLHELLKKRGL